MPLGLLGRLAPIGVGQRWLFSCGCILRWWLGQPRGFETSCDVHRLWPQVVEVVRMLDGPTMNN